MTDIDFDELDRAVSSLMDKQREKEAPVVANENNSEVSASVFVEEKPVPENSIGTSFAPPVTPFTPSSVASAPLSSISQPEAKKSLLATIRFLKRLIALRTRKLLMIQ